MAVGVGKLAAAARLSRTSRGASPAQAAASRSCGASSLLYCRQSRALANAAAAEEPSSSARSQRAVSCCVPLASTRFDAKTPPSSPEPPLILVHGLLGSQMTYRSLVKRKDFAPTRVVYTVDLRNHGQSPQVSEMHYSSLSYDVFKFMDAEGLEEACVVGHSVGGKVAMLMALEQPERVSELVVIDIPPANTKSRGEVVSNSAQAMHDIDIENYSQKSDIENALKEHGVQDERVRQFLMTNVTSDNSSPGFYKWKLHIQSIQENIEGLQSFPTLEDDAKYNGPALFLYGDKGGMLRVEDEPLVRSRFPRARMRKVQDAGHWLAADNPEGFCRALNDFLAASPHSAPSAK